MEGAYVARPEQRSVVNTLLQTNTSVGPSEQTAVVSVSGVLAFAEVLLGNSDHATTVSSDDGDGRRRVYLFDVRDSNGRQRCS
jgi:hypothetical protein